MYLENNLKIVIFSKNWKKEKGGGGDILTYLYKLHLT